MYYYRRNSSTVPVLIALPPETIEWAPPSRSNSISALSATITGLPRRPSQTATVWRPFHRDRKNNHRLSFGASSYHGSFRHAPCPTSTSPPPPVPALPTHILPAKQPVFETVAELEENEYDPRKPGRSWYDHSAEEDVSSAHSGFPLRDSLVSPLSPCQAPTSTYTNCKNHLQKPNTIISTEVQADPEEHNTPLSIAREVQPSSPLTNKVYTPIQKRLILLASATAAMFLALNGLIYFPSLTLISSDLSVSLQSVQLTITSSLVVAGLVPAFTGDMADNLGRRPVYLVMFSLMICANLGIALLPNMNGYIGLLVLRMLQSAGSSGMLGFAYGVIVDIAEVEERGGFVGVLLLMADVAASVGPVVGGGLTQLFGWCAIFWFLVILTGTHFVGMFLFFPETSRILRNSTIENKRWGIVYRSLWSLMRDNDGKAGKRRTRTWVSKFNRVREEDTAPIILSYEDEQQQGLRARGPTQHSRKLRFPNPLACLGILLHSKGSLTVVAINAVNSAVKAAMQAVLGAQCVRIYGLTYLQAGLIYIPSGLGGSLGAYAAGRFVDWNYHRWQAEMMAQTMTPDEKEALTSQTAGGLPLERIRLRGLHLLSLTTVLGLVGFGLALEVRAHIAVMLVLQLLMGASTAASFTLCGTLLTDLNPTKSATAQAADNLARCTSAAGAVAVLQPLFAGLNPARACVVYASVSSLCFPLGWLLERMGGRWRAQAAERSARMAASMAS